MQLESLLNQCGNFYLNEVFVDPRSNVIQKGTEKCVLQPKQMTVLTYLAIHSGRVVSNEELLEHCWPNQFISDSPIQKCIAQLRKSLGDPAKQSKFIKTVSKKGYILIAQVSGLDVTLSNKASIGVANSEWIGQQPFVGSSAYDISHKLVFFGREKYILALRDRLLVDQQAALPIIKIKGDPRVGKTSFVRAGFAPFLITHQPLNTVDFHNLIDLDLEKLSLVEALKLIARQLLADNVLKHVAPWNMSDFDGDKANSLLPCIEELVDALGAQTKSYILLFDHISYQRNDSLFETLITQLKASERCLVICIPDINGVSGEQKTNAIDLTFDLPALDFRALQTFMLRVAEVSGFNFEFDELNQCYLNDVIIDELIEFKLPLSSLQNTLFKLFELDNRSTLSISSYRQSGGVRGTFLEHVTSQFNKLSIAEKTRFKAQLFHFYRVDAQGKSIAPSAHNNLNQLSAADKALFHSLIKTDILEYDQIKYQLRLACYPCIEEALNLKEWLKTHAKFIFFYLDLVTLVRRWQNQQQQPDYIVGNEQFLQSASEIRKYHQVSFTLLEQEYLQLLKSKLAKHSRNRHSFVALLSTLVIALTWLAVDLKNATLSLTQTQSNAENLISFMVYDLKEKLEPIGKLDVLESVGLKASEYFDAQGVDNLSPRSSAQWLKSLLMLGEVSYNRLEYQQANTFFNKCLKISSNLLKQDPNSIELLELNMLANYWLGELQFEKKEYAAVEPYWLAYKAIAKKLTTLEPSEDKWTKELSYSFNNLGALSIRQNKLTVAERFLSISIKLKQAVSAKNPQNLNSAIDLANSLSWRGRFYKKIDLIKSTTDYQSSLNLLSSLFQQNPENNKVLYKKVLVEQNLANNFYKMGRFKKANQLITKNLSAIKSLIENDPTNKRYLERHFQSNIILARILLDTNSKEEIERIFYQANESIRKLEKITDIQSSTARQVFLLNIEKSRFFYLNHNTKNADFFFNQAWLNYISLIEKNSATDSQFLRLSLLSYLLKQPINHPAFLDKFKEIQSRWSIIKKQIAFSGNFEEFKCTVLDQKPTCSIPSPHYNNINI